MSRRLTEEPLDPAAALAAVAGIGYTACVFAGTVRRTNRGREVVSLTYEAHGPMARRVLAELEEEAEAAEGVDGCRVRHRLGTLGVGEVSVVVAVAASSHEAAVDAARRTMDELKERLPVWKKERYADGEARHLEGRPLEDGSRDSGSGDADGGHAETDGSRHEAPEGGSP